SWFPYERRGFAQGLLWLCARWGGAVAPFLVAWASAPAGWRGAFYIFGVVGALWVFCFWFYFRDSPRQHPGVNEPERHYIEGDATVAAAARLPISWASMLASPTLWCLSLMYFCSNAGWCFFITWDLRYYSEVLGLEDQALRLASGAPLFCGGIACL